MSSQEQRQSPADLPLEEKREEVDEEEDDSEDKKGRRKIEISFIENKSRRHITFSKRKAGIMKKAYELATLTGTQVLLLVASETGHVYTFATPKLQPLITNPEGKNLIQACLNAPDQLSASASPEKLPSAQQPSYLAPDLAQKHYQAHQMQPSGYNGPEGKRMGKVETNSMGSSAPRLADINYPQPMSVSGAYPSGQLPYPQSPQASYPPGYTSAASYYQPRHPQHQQAPTPYPYQPSFSTPQQMRQPDSRHDDQ